VLKKKKEINLTQNTLIDWPDDDGDDESIRRVERGSMIVIHVPQDVSLIFQVRLIIWRDNQ
jgi:hypothetical protein